MNYKVKCESCGAVNRLPDEDIVRRRSPAKCGKCGSLISEYLPQTVNWEQSAKDFLFQSVLHTLIFGVTTGAVFGYLVSNILLVIFWNEFDPNQYGDVPDFFYASGIVGVVGGIFISLFDRDENFFKKTFGELIAPLMACFFLGILSATFLGIIVAIVLYEIFGLRDFYFGLFLLGGILGGIGVITFGLFSLKK